MSKNTEYGRLDPDFGINGIALLDVAAEYDGCSRSYPNGSIISIGSATPTNSIVIFKHDAQGVPEAGFGNNGMLILELAADLDFSLRNIIIQDDSKVVIFGSAGEGRQAVFARLLENSRALDPDFGDNGLKFVNIIEGLSIESWRRYTGITLRKDQSIVTVMEIQNSRLGVRTGLIISLDKNGHLETGFGNAGVTYANGLFVFENLVALDNGKLLIVGSHDRGGLVACYTREGHPDFSYDKYGHSFVLIDGQSAFTVSLHAIAQHEQKTLVTGFIFKGDFGSPLHSIPILTQLESDGALDKSFNHGKEVEFESDINLHGRSILVQKNGASFTLLAAPFYSKGKITKLLATGAPDNSFAPNGQIEFELPANIYPKEMVWIANNRLLVGGSSQPGYASGGAIACFLIE